MSPLPDVLLMKLEMIAQQIENAYNEGVADAKSGDEALPSEIWNNSVAKIFADRYRKIGERS